MAKSVDSSRITVHMVSSLDGLIAKPDNGIGWFETTDHYKNGRPAMDPEEFSKSVDCYVMGSRTFEHATELAENYGWPYGDKPTIVVTRRSLASDRPGVEFFSGDLPSLAGCLKKSYRNSWVVGGAALVNEFLRLGLADEIRQPILPIILGDGVPFYKQFGSEILLHLKEATAYTSGMVELCYEIKRE